MNLNDRLDDLYIQNRILDLLEIHSKKEDDSFNIRNKLNDIIKNN